MMEAPLDGDAGGLAPFTRLVLDLRGVRFMIDRETVVNLPESILLCLFPNGLLLADTGESGENGSGDDEQVYLVDFDSQCLEYVLGFFRQAQEYFYGNDNVPGVFGGFAIPPHMLEFGMDGSAGMFGGLVHPFQLPLFHKQAVIVLREELEYFAIPPPFLRRTAAEPLPEGNAPPSASPEYVQLKELCGDALLARRQVFSALQRSVNKENNVAEQHLIDMLCMSGFHPDDRWGYRAREPNRCCITSTALVLLKTGITHAGELPGQASAATPQRPLGVQRDPATAEAMATTPVDQLGEWLEDGQGGVVRVNQQQLTTAQKLLLFWRKPARKCWWDGVDVVVPAGKLGLSEKEKRQSGTALPTSDVLATMAPDERAALQHGTGRLVRVWARRVWTLEVSLI